MDDFFSSPSKQAKKIFSQEKKIKKPKKKSVIKKNENFFSCFCFFCFSFFPSTFFLYFSPLFHFWNVCVISRKCFNRIWLEFVSSIRLERFLESSIKKKIEREKKTKHFALSITLPLKNRSSAVVYLITARVRQKNIFLSFKKTKRVQEKNANKKKS